MPRLLVRLVYFQESPLTWSAYIDSITSGANPADGDQYYDEQHVKHVRARSRRLSPTATSKGTQDHHDLDPRTRHRRVRLHRRPLHPSAPWSASASAQEHVFTEGDWSPIDGPGVDAYGKSKILAERAASAESLIAKSLVGN
jgi:hypothetical protein